MCKTIFIIININQKITKISKKIKKFKLIHHVVLDSFGTDKTI